MLATLRLLLIVSLIGQLALSVPCCTLLILWPSLVCAGGEGDACRAVGPMAVLPASRVACAAAVSPRDPAASPCGGRDGCGTPVTNSCDDGPGEAPCETPCDEGDCDTCPPTVPQKVPGEKDVKLALPLVVAPSYTIELPRPSRRLVVAAIEPHPPPSHHERRARLGVWLN